MAYEYLKALSLSEQDEQKLRSLGARTPASLLSLIEHSPHKFVQLLGEEQTARIQVVLRGLIPESEKAQLESLPAFRGKFGATVPSGKNPAESIARRDQLMRRIKMIRESNSSSPAALELLKKLEDELRDELKSTA